MPWRVPTSVAVLCAAVSASAQWYAWTDEGGTLQVTNQLATAPPALNGRVAVLPFEEAPDGLASADPAVPGPDRAGDPRAAALRRCKARLAARWAHWRLLRGLERKTAEQLRVENQLQDEIRAAKAAMQALRAQKGDRP